MSAPEMLLDEDLVAFLQGGVSIVAASRDADNIPTLARAVGCQVAEDRRRVTILLPSESSRVLLDAVRSSGTLAVVFSQPTTHRTVQLKAVDAAPVAVDAACRGHLDGYAARFATELDAIGYSEEFARALVASGRDGLAAISFTPHVAFTQTPGPGAGDPLGS